MEPIWGSNMDLFFLILMAGNLLIWFLQRFKLKEWRSLKFVDRLKLSAPYNMTYSDKSILQMNIFNKCAHNLNLMGPRIFKVSFYEVIHHNSRHLLSMISYCGVLDGNVFSVEMDFWRAIQRWVSWDGTGFNRGLRVIHCNSPIRTLVYAGNIVYS